MSKKLALASLGMILLFIMVGCAGTDARVELGLQTYTDKVIAGTPTSVAASRATGVGGVGVTMGKIFNNETEAGNLVGESKKLDALIAEINTNVTADNTADGSGYNVIPNTGKTLTLPFFGETVDIDYLINMGDSTSGSKYAGYKLDGSTQTVVLFHTGSAGVDRDVSLFYGKKTDTTIDIWQALIGVDASDVKKKGWAFKIHIDIEGGTFTITHNSDWYTHSGIGNSKGIFILREWETTLGTAGTRDCAVLYDFAAGAYTVLDDFSPAASGAVMATTDLTKPASISDAYWTTMINFANAIGDPDLVGICPESLTDFTNDFIKSKF